MQDRFSFVKRFKGMLATSLVCAGMVSTAGAASWPTNPVTIVVPFSPGGTTDVVARLLAQKLGEMWNQSVVIDNKLGAGGNIGTGIVAKSNPDGYTMLMASGSIFTVNPHLYKSLPFDAEKDFIPVTEVAAGPMVVVTSKKLGVKSLQELLDKAKAAPKALNMGSAGLGSQVHMAGENFSHAAKVKFTHVPYRGEAASYTDLMAGQIDVVVGNIGAVTSLVEGGRVDALAVTSKERAPMLPNVPTVAESGVPGFENYGWFGFMVPKGTPPAVTKKIREDTVKVLAMPDIKKRLAALGMTAGGNTPEQFSKDIKEESKKWARVITDQNISIN